MLGYSGILMSFITYHLDRDPEANLLELIPDIEQVFYEQMSARDSEIERK